MHCHIENLSGEFHRYLPTHIQREGGLGGKMAKMNAWEDNVSKINCLTKVL